MYTKYEDIDNVVADFNKAFDYAEKNLNKLNQEIKEKTAKIKYEASAILLGACNPSLIEHKIISGLKKGKLLNQTPQKSQSYNEYYFDNFDNLLFIKQRYKDPRFEHATYYVFDLDGYKYFIYVCNSEVSRTGGNYRAKYNENDLLLYEEINSAISIYSEFYFNEQKSQGYIKCETMRYVADISGTIKKIVEECGGTEIKAKMFGNSKFLEKMSALKLTDADRTKPFSPRRSSYDIILDEKGKIMEIKNQYRIINLAKKKKAETEKNKETENTGAPFTKESKKILKDKLTAGGFNIKKGSFLKLWEVFKSFNDIKFNCREDDFLWEIYSNKDCVSYHLMRQFTHYKKDSYSHMEQLDIEFSIPARGMNFSDTLWLNDYNSFKDFTDKIEKLDSFKFAAESEDITDCDINFGRV